MLGLAVRPPDGSVARFGQQLFSRARLLRTVGAMLDVWHTHTHAFRRLFSFSPTDSSAPVAFALFCRFVFSPFWARFWSPPARLTVPN